MKLRNLTAIGCLGVILVACGGGNGGDDLGTVAVPGGGTSTGNSSVPSSALQSVDAFVAFLRQLGADETSEPLTLPNVAPPTNDTTEPSA